MTPSTLLYATRRTVIRLADLRRVVAFRYRGQKKSASYESPRIRGITTFEEERRKLVSAKHLLQPERVGDERRRRDRHSRRIRFVVRTAFFPRSCSSTSLSPSLPTSLSTLWTHSHTVPPRHYLPLSSQADRLGMSRLTI